MADLPAWAQAIEAQIIAESLEEDRLFYQWMEEHPREGSPEYYEQRMTAEVSGAALRPTWMLNSLGYATVEYYMVSGVDRWKRGDPRN